MNKMIITTLSICTLTTFHLSSYIYVTSIVNNSPFPITFHCTAATDEKNRTIVVSQGKRYQERIECFLQHGPAPIGHLFFGTDPQHPYDVHTQPKEKQCVFCVIGGNQPNLLDKSHEEIEIIVKKDGTISPRASYPQHHETLTRKRQGRRGNTYYIPGFVRVPSSLPGSDDTT